VPRCGYNPIGHSRRAAEHIPLIVPSLHSCDRALAFAEHIPLIVPSLHSSDRALAFAEHIPLIVPSSCQQHASPHLHSTAAIEPSMC
jgi:hypothetical protein